jgi:hypothetical protein
MFNRLSLLLLLFLGLVSCERIIHNNKIDSSQIKPEPIDFSSIDAYPLLPDCEDITTRDLQKECFYKLLSKKIELALSKKHIALTTNNKDTIQVTINVSSKGIVNVKSINLSNDDIFNELKNAIIQSVENLPTIQPAIKSGIPVTTEFVLPIVLKPNS